MMYLIGILIGLILLYLIFRPSCSCERFTIYGLLSNQDACSKCIKPYEEKLKKLKKEWVILEEKIKHIKHGKTYILNFRNNNERDNFNEKLATILRIGVENIYIARKEDKKIIFTFTYKDKLLEQATENVNNLDNIFSISNNSLVSDFKKGINGINKTLFNLGVISVEYENVYIYI